MGGIGREVSQSMDRAFDPTQCFIHRANKLMNFARGFRHSQTTFDLLRVQSLNFADRRRQWSQRTPDNCHVKDEQQQSERR